MNKFNVVCPDKVIFNLNYESAMRVAHQEFEAVKHEYLQRYEGCGGEILAQWQGVEYFAWEHGKRQKLVFTEKAEL